MTFDVVNVQSKILKVFGFIRLIQRDNFDPDLEASTKHRRTGQSAQLKSVIQITVSSSLLISASAVFLMMISKMVFEAHSTTQSTSGPPDSFIVRAVSYLKYGFYPIRAILILIFFLAKISSWADLHSRIQHFIKVSRVLVPGHFQRISTWLFILTFFLHATFISTWWWWTIESGNASVYLTGEMKSCYVTACLSIIEDFAMWFFTIETAFILSQQVLVCGVICAVVILRALNELEHSIVDYETASTSGKLTLHSPSDEQDAVLRALNWCELRQKVRTWTMTYTALHKLVGKMNGTFSWIWLVSVVSDTVTALGLGADLVIPNVSLSAGAAIYSVAACGLFVSYATVLFLPFVFLHDKVR